MPAWSTSASSATAHRSPCRFAMTFGQRRFGLFDPAGVWIDVVEQIEPAAGWWDKYLHAEP